MKKLILILLLSVSFNFVFAEKNQTIDPPMEQSIFDLVSFREVMEVTLEMDLEKMLSNRRSEEKFKAQFSFIDRQGNHNPGKLK